MDNCSVLRIALGVKDREIDKSQSNPSGAPKLTENTQLVTYAIWRKPSNLHKDVSLYRGLISMRWFAALGSEQTHRGIYTKEKKPAQLPLFCLYVSLSWIWLLVVILLLSPFKSNVCCVISGLARVYTLSCLTSKIKFFSASHLTWPACVSVFFQLFTDSSQSPSPETQIN